MTDSVCIYCGATVPEGGHSAYDCIQVLRAKLAEQDLTEIENLISYKRALKKHRALAPVKHPASDPPKHPNWVIVCIKGEVFPAVYVHNEWHEWWGDDEPLYTPDWWCELPYRFNNH